MTAFIGGRITTFYSYKGGTGRTMALANVAWILAAHGERVLVVDWDLEAPGLHRFFLPFMNDPNLRKSDGLVDMVSEYVDALGKQSEAGQVTSDLLRLADPRRHAIALQFDFEGEGCLHLLAAGRQDRQYAERVRGLDWQQFYISFGGEAFIERFAATMRQQYDYVLIDSRTGVADSAGICTMQMPDQVVLCFTYNRQSVEGVAAAASSITKYAQSKDRRIRLLPLPTRVIPDIEGLEDAREFAQRALAPYLPDLKDPDDLLAFWASAEVPHYPAYGFEETLATFRERAGGRNNLLADMEWLTGEICGSREPQRLASMPSSVRERYLRRFRLRDPRRAALDEALDKDPTSALLQVLSLVRRFKLPEDSEWAAVLAGALQRVATRLSEAGRWDEAVKADEEAVNIRRQLAASKPDSLKPDLAMSLNNLALRLSAVGQREAALAPAQEAVAIGRELAAKAPDAYRPDLAMALNNLSTFLSEVGRRQAALGPAREAVDLYRDLAAKAPDAYRTDLANALSNLAAFLSEVGQREAALAPAKEAVNLHRELAAEAPDVYREDLAAALGNLSTSLSDVGQRQEALAAAKEAADLYRALAAKAPDVVTPSLARALANLGIRFGEVNQHEAALGPAKEATGLFRALAATQPDASLPDLANALNNLALHLNAVGQRQEALQVAEEAIQTLGPRFLELPAAFAPWMRSMVRNYEKRCQEAGRDPDAELLTPILDVLKGTQGGEESGA